jgi:hypothetical protein
LNISTSGTCTITAGTATVATAGSLALGLNQGGTLYFTSAGVSVFQADGVAAAAGGLTLISATTIGTTVASVTVSSAFSSTYDNYKIIVTGGTGTVNNELLQLKLGATTTGYSAGYTGVTYSTGAANLTNDNNAANWSRFGVVQTNGLVGNLDLLGPNLAKNTYIIGTQIADTVSRSGSGLLANTTQYTDFTFTPATGTLTGGTIRVYGYANS